ncbi:MAG: DNA repair protein RadC [Nitrospinota bacterium]
MSDDKKREGHRERLRTKFLEHGLEKFTDEEIAELLLTLATPRKDCKQPAREALKKFKTLRNVFEATLDELVSIKGIGPNNAFGIKFIYQITRKFLRDRMLSRPFLRSSEEVLEYLDHAMRSSGQEAFRIIYLSPTDEVIDEETIAVGTATEVPVTPAQIVQRAIERNAANIVLAHNHPGGDSEPSAEDRGLTKEVVFIAGMMNLRLREHLIIAPRGRFSFAQEGLIARYEEEFERFYKKRFR